MSTHTKELINLLTQQCGQIYKQRKLSDFFFLFYMNLLFMIINIKFEGKKNTLVKYLK